MKTGQVVRVMSRDGQRVMHIGAIEKVRVVDVGVQLKVFRFPGWVGAEQVRPLKEVR